MLKAIRCGAAAALFLPLLALGQAEPPASVPGAPAGAPPTAPATPPEAAKPPPWYSAVVFSGFVDAYYQARLDAAQDAPVAQRAFDSANGFNLGDAVLSAAMAPAPAGFRLDLQFGNTATAIDGVAAFSAGTTPQPTFARYVLQAYVAMKLGPAELDVGRFVTSSSAEVVPAKDNWLYSRSLLYNLVPVGHTGAHLSLPVGALTLRAGVVNGWDAVSSSYAAKTAELQIAYAGPSNTTASLTAYIGPNPTVWSGAANTKGAYRTLVDAVAGTTVGPLGLLANFDWATEAADAWWGASLTARYALPGDLLRVTARGEYVKDLHGARFATGVDTHVWEGTAGVAVPVGASSELRVEARYDKASENVFSPTKDSQLTGTLAALAWF